MVKIKKLISEHGFDFLAVLLIISTLPLFFYKLGQSSLVSWDEAWYADISRNILRTGDLFNLIWNGNPYYDHPPMGYWLEALSFKLFGINEFWARFPSAVFGVIGLTTTYLLGKELFNKTVGLASTIALSSAIWFIYRSRAGDLDIFLTTFFIMTLYMALKAVKNKKFLIPLSLSLAFLFLTKTGVPFIIIPSLLLIWGGKKLNTKEILLPILIFLAVAGGWFVIQLLSQPDFISRYLSIGLPGIKSQSSFLSNFNQSKEYLHSGIGKWFWPGLLGIFGGLLFFQKRFLILSIFFLLFFIPFILSPKGHIWHLVPLYPIMILSFFGFMYSVLKIIIANFKIFHAEFLITVALLSSSLYISYFQIKQIWYQFIDIPAYISDEAILSKEAGKLPFPFFIDENYTPAAAFYSGKEVQKFTDGSLKYLFDDQNLKNFVLITAEWRLNQSGINISQYKILKSDRDKILITRAADLD